MNTVMCGDCWRQENLTFAQRLDPACVRPGYRHLCAEHLARQDELLGGTDLGRSAA